MKNNLLKYYIAAVYLCSTFVLFAQPGDTDGGAGLETNDPAAPIDDFIPLLALIGIILVFMRFRAIRIKQIKRQNRTF